MDANQRSRVNPFGMDEECRNCPALCETRTQVVHGFGDVGADFLFVGEAPSSRADRIGIPFVDEPAQTADRRTTPTNGGEEEVGDDSPAGTQLRKILERLGLADATAPPDRPEVVNVYLTNLTRCRDPERAPTDEEVRNCDPYLEAEIRMINPELIVPIGTRALEEIVIEYTTDDPEDIALDDVHGTVLRGRGFELVPMIEPREQTPDQTQEWVESFAAVLASDYRQTKGRQGR